METFAIRCVDFFQQRTVFKSIFMDNHRIILKVDSFQADTIAEGTAFNFMQRSRKSNRKDSALIEKAAFSNLFNSLRDFHMFKVGKEFNQPSPVNFHHP